ncbi:MAG: hypothetical protein ABJ370_12485 [Paracoccaceae bacterium]
MMQSLELKLDGRNLDVNSIASDLQSSGVSVDLNQCFETQGYDAPFVKFSPTPLELPHPKLITFYSACKRMAGPEERLKARDFDKDSISHLTDYLMILDVKSRGTEFLYSYYGEGIRGLRGLSMVGRTSEYFTGHISRFFTATYRAACHRKESVFTIHEAPSRVFVSDWKRLIIPLFDDQLQTVVRFAVVNMPDNNFCAGLDVVPDPILVADRDMVLRYTNAAASKMFGGIMQFGSRLNVNDFAGLELNIPESPEALAAEGTVRDIASISLRNHLIQRFLVTVSGLVMNKRAFYVIGLRPVFEDMNCRFS